MNNRFEELAEEFDKILIPQIKPQPLTFLGITKQAHYENIWSNIYAFYFNPLAEHGLGNLFIHSLKKLLGDSTINYFLDGECMINTEVPTEKNKRIDILLNNSEDAIIIENKVFHHLNNDLEEYWNSIKQKNKAGVVLSLFKIPIDNANFINITHHDLMNKVSDNLGDFYIGANEKYLFLLKDFHQNIINITNHTDMIDKDLVEFNINYLDKIEQAKTIQSNYKNQIIRCVETTSEDERLSRFFYMDKINNSRLRYLRCQTNPNLMFTIVFDKLFTKEMKLTFIVEVQNNSEHPNIKDKLSKKKHVNSIEWTEAENRFINQEKLANTDEYLHIAVEEHFLTKDDIVGLKEYLINKILISNLLKIYNKIKLEYVEKPLADD